MRRNCTQLYVHLVWATWDRLPLITSALQIELYRVIAAECRQMGCHVIAIGGIEDHVHVLMGFPSNVAIAAIVKQVKGSSSHWASHQAKPEAFFKWQGSYAAFTVNPKDIDVVAEYIHHQAEHHIGSTNVPDWEIFAEHQ
jgi:putative transposase